MSVGSLASDVLGHFLGVTLDVGCGPGRMSHALAAQGACVLGIDPTHPVRLVTVWGVGYRWEAT